MAENNKTSIEKLLDDHLQGLILPAEDAVIDSLFWWGMGLLLCFVLYLIWRYLKRRNHPRQIALRKIRVLRGLVGKSSSKKNTAIFLASILRKGLGTPQLASFKPRSVNKWEGFMEKLETASYSANEATDNELMYLFEQSEYWLRNS